MSEPAESGGKGPFWTRRRIQAGVAILVVVVVGSLLATSRGCRPSHRVSKAERQDPNTQTAQQNQRFDAAWDSLQRPEVFDGMFAADDQTGQDIDQLNQWLDAQKPLADWQVDPLAAPLAKSLGSCIEYVKPVDAAMNGPRDVLELKDIVRHFEAPAARLDNLAQRRSLAELNQLARHYDDSLKQIDDVARKTGDALREARDSSQDPASVKGRAGGGAGDTEAQLNVYESQMLVYFFRRVTDPAKRANFDEFCRIARQLDYSGRLREPRSLAALAQALGEFAAKHDRKEVEPLVVQYEEVVNTYADPFRKTRLSAQLRFILDELNNSARMKDLAEWKALDQVVGEVAERLKIAAKRTGRTELGELAAQVEEARNKRDTVALKTAAAQLAGLVRPGSTDDLKNSAAQLADRAKLLVQLAGQLGPRAEQSQSQGLQGLAGYVAALSEDVQQAAKLLANPPPTVAPQDSDAYVDQFTVQYALVGARVSRLAEDLDYFATLGAVHFPPADGTSLREAILLRDVSRWTRGEEADDVSRAKRLFDWTVRNIQLEPDKADPAIPHFMQRPWETLIWGRGTAMERSWVFVLLARQQGLDAALLALEDAGETPAPQGRLRPWAVAVLSEKELYLFDPHLGLAIPGPGAVKLDESGQLDVRPATLAQVLADEQLLRQMDLATGRPYWVRGTHLKRVVALVEGSAPYLAQRMRVVESRLSGEDRVVLSAAPTAQADRIKGCRGIAEVRLWSLPYETWFQRVQVGDQPLRQLGAALQRISAGSLWRGRVRHLEGKFTGESSAVQFYGKARPLDREIDAMAAAVRGEGQGAGDGGRGTEGSAAAASASLRAFAMLAKQNAGYWLGLMAFEQGRTDPRKYAMAADYLAGGTIDRYPDGPWTPGAKYNLGRVYEVQKNYSQAIQQYRGHPGSAQSYGDQLRARWLEKLTGAEPPSLPGLPVEKEPAKKEGPSKKEVPSKEPPKVVPPGKEKPGIPDLPGLPGLPTEKEPPKKAAPPKKEAPPTELPKAVLPKKEKPGIPDLPILPGLE